MNNNKKILLWGSFSVILLAAVIVMLFINLSSGKDKEEFIVATDKVSVYSGIPSDAVVIADFKHLAEYAPLLYDTLSFARNLLQQQSGMVEFQKELLAQSALEQVPFVYSLHYSAKNSVSFLQVADLAGVDQAVLGSVLGRKGNERRKYNNVSISAGPAGVLWAMHKNLLLASSSSYVLESAIRHLENNTSILDKPDFERMLAANGNETGIYVNHSQIGKLFSGVVERDFLGYSDFVMNFAEWSYFRAVFENGRLSLQGVLDDCSDESVFSNIFGSLSARKSYMTRILPASTVFAVSLPVSGMHEYLKQHGHYLEMQKKAGKFAYLQKMAKGERATAPRAWVDSLEIEEIVSAYCKFGEKCEWLTIIREKQQFGLNNVISSVVDRDKVVAPVPFGYKGYVASVFGELFSHCNEEYVCRMGPWMIIGPKAVLDDYSNGGAVYFTLEDYLLQTPAEKFVSSDASAKIMVNLKEGGDSVLQVLKTYPRECLQRQLQHNNFEVLVADIAYVDGESRMNVDFYASVLAEVPKPDVRSDGQTITFTVDSTVNVPAGPFEVRDVVKKAPAYLEQLPNMRLRYMDANRKGVWAIPFSTPICGYVEQIDLYNNGRLQMLFISGNKLYLLDRLGRFVYGYPAKLNKEVVLGPKLVKNENGHKYSFVVLNADNTISWYDISGKPVQGWNDIVAPEFIKELPELTKIGNAKYWVLNAPSQKLLFTHDGKRLVMGDKRKKIDRDSEIGFVQEGVLRVKCTDGREYSWNLATGKTKRI